MKKVLIAIVSLCFIVTGCAGVNQDSQPRIDTDKDGATQIGGITIERFIDEDAEVVCWIAHDKSIGSGVGVGVGISCLPLRETSLDR